MLVGCLCWQHHLINNLCNIVPDRLGCTTTFTGVNCGLTNIQGWERNMIEAQENAAERAVQYLQERGHKTVRRFCGTKKVGPPIDCWQVNQPCPSSLASRYLHLVVKATPTLLHVDIYLQMIVTLPPLAVTDSHPSDRSIAHEVIAQKDSPPSLCRMTCSIVVFWWRLSAPTYMVQRWVLQLMGKFA